MGNPSAEMELNFKTHMKPKPKCNKTLDQMQKFIDEENQSIYCKFLLAFQEQENVEIVVVILPCVVC